MLGQNYSREYEPERGLHLTDRLRMAHDRLSEIAILRHYEWPTDFAAAIIRRVLPLAEAISRHARLAAASAPLVAEALGRLASSASRSIGPLVPYARAVAEESAGGSPTVLVPGLRDAILRALRELASIWEEVWFVDQAMPSLLRLSRAQPPVAKSWARTQQVLDETGRWLTDLTIPAFPGQRRVYGPPAPEWYERWVKDEKRRERRRSWLALGVLATAVGASVLVYRRYA